MYRKYIFFIVLTGLLTFPGMQTTSAMWLDGIMVGEEAEEAEESTEQRFERHKQEGIKHEKKIQERAAVNKQMRAAREESEKLKERMKQEYWKRERQLEARNKK